MSPASNKINSKKTIQYSLDGLFGRFASGWKRLSAKDVKAVTKALRERGLLQSSANTGGTNPEQYLKNLVAALPQVAQSVLPERFPQQVLSTSFAFVPVATGQDDDSQDGAVVRAFHVKYGEGTSGNASRSCDVAKTESAIDKEIARVRLSDVGITHIWGIDKDEAHRLGVAVAERILQGDIRRKFHFTVSNTAKNLDRVTVSCHSRIFISTAKPFNMYKDAKELVQLMLFATFAIPEQLGCDSSLDALSNTSTQAHLPISELAEVISKGPLHPGCLRAVEAGGPLEGLTKFARPDGADYVLRDYTLCDANLNVPDLKSRQDLIVDTLMEVAGIYGDDKLSSCDMIEQLSGSWQHGYHYNRGPTNIINPRMNLVKIRAPSGENLPHVDDPTVYFQALSLCASAANHLRSAGLVHHGFYPENIMVHYRQPTAPASTEDANTASQVTVEIASMEFSKPYKAATDWLLSLLQKDDGPNRYGPTSFTPVEVSQMRHLFGEADDYRQKSLSSGFFAYNFLHDLEPLLWIALKFFHRHTPLRPPEGMERWPVYKDALMDVATWAHKLFPCSGFLTIHSDLDFRPRVNLLKYRENRDSVNRALAQVYGENSPVLRIADLFQDLAEAYGKIEEAPNHILLCGRERLQLPKSTRFDPSLFEQHVGVYDRVRDVLKEVSAHFASGNDSLVKWANMNWDTGAPLQCEPPPKADSEFESDPEFGSSATAALGQRAQEAAPMPSTGTGDMTAQTDTTDDAALEEETLVAETPTTEDAVKLGKRKAEEEPEADQPREAKRQAFVASEPR
ncbi:uncharacterized protein SCHCODRAFT_02675277 [Schizophyllum commune H4-8]|nr:uncharacterized protein SCHCODRAFT_02675277 [Schizophyllum commune H4-8]KAI5897667.1 hypothetical protein SCHCODRAFT_02675277 [Schizophyllum commune H4-8]